MILEIMIIIYLRLTVIKFFNSVVKAVILIFVVVIIVNI
jgi:hypothetical protein